MLDYIKNNKISVGILTFIVVGVGVYYFFFMDSGLPAGLEGSDVPPEVREVGTRVFNMVQQFQNVKFEQEFFSAPVFLSFSKFDYDLAPKDQGREDPFAPLGDKTGDDLIPKNGENATSSVEVDESQENEETDL